MITVRPVRWPEDVPALSRIEATFTTDRIYWVERTDLGFTLWEVPVDPPVTKRLCTLAEEVEDLRRMEHVVVAEVGGELAGVAAANYSEWNGRVVLWHLYVQPGARRTGVGRLLLDSVVDYARRVGAWCVWLETQDINYPAIQFYRRCGFQICGVDEALYHPDGPAAGEVGIFMVRPVR
jgi:ribosomal protein S18 acetylase RimI-like enzyme